MKKSKTKKITNVFLLIVTFSCILFQSIGIISSENVSFAQKSDISIEKVDDFHAKICYNDGKSLNNNILIEKRSQDNGFTYIAKSCELDKEVFSFNSEKDIEFNSESLKANPKMNAAVWSFYDALKKNDWDTGKALLAMGGAFSGIAGNPIFITVVDLIAENGVLAIPSVIGLLSGGEILLLVGSVGGVA